MWVVAIPVVQEKNCPRDAPLDGTSHYLLGSGPVGIPDAERPSDGPLAQVARDRCDPRAPKSMRRTEETRTGSRRAHDRVSPELEIPSHVSRAAEVQLPVMKAMVPESMAALGDATRELRPLFDVAPEQKERSGHVFHGEDVENPRRRGRSGAVIESESDLFLVRRKTRQRAADYRAVSMKGG